MTTANAAGADPDPSMVTAARSGLTFVLLGAVRGWRDGRELDLGQPQQRVALVVLLLQVGRPVSVDAIVQAVWGDAAPASARGVIHGYVHRLRRVLAAGATVR
jgi:DNA-binding SARP family transcriptional activator